MDELLTKEFKEAVMSDDADTVKQLINKAGYVRINTGKNVVITTGDNEGGKLMTEQEWREKFNG